MDYKLVHQYHSYFKNAGFNIQKDVLGTYFTKLTHKFSIMKHAHMYICFYNVFKDNQWVTVAKSQPFMNYVQALQWVYDKAKNII